MDTKKKKTRTPRYLKIKSNALKYVVFLSFNCIHIIFHILAPIRDEVKVQESY